MTAFWRFDVSRSSKNWVCLHYYLYGWSRKQLRTQHEKQKYGEVYVIWKWLDRRSSTWPHQQKNSVLLHSAELNLRYICIAAATILYSYAFDPRFRTSSENVISKACFNIYKQFESESRSINFQCFGSSRLAFEVGPVFKRGSRTIAAGCLFLMLSCLMSLASIWFCITISVFR